MILFLIELNVFLQENSEGKLDSKPGNWNEKAPLNVLDALAHHTADVEAGKFENILKLLFREAVVSNLAFLYPYV